MKNKKIWIVLVLLVAGISVALAGICFGGSKTTVIPLATQYEDAYFTISYKELFYDENPEYTGYLMLFDYQPCTVSRVEVNFEKSEAHTLYFFGDDYEIIKQVNVRKGQKTVLVTSAMKGLAFSVRDEELGTVSVRIQTTDKVESNLDFPTVSILGDSMSAFDWTVPKGYNGYYPEGDVELEDMWWNSVAEELGMRVLINNSSAGAGVSELEYEGVTKDMAACNGRGKNLSLLGEDPDNIWVLIGGNDVLMDVSPVKIDRAYRNLLEDIRETYPKAEVTLIGYFHDQIFPSKDFDWLNTEIEYLAKSYDCEFISLSGCGISDKNADHVTVDYDEETETGIHPSKEGMEMISEYFLKQFREAENENSNRNQSKVK